MEGCTVNHDGHVSEYKRHRAIQYLGTKHCLHRQYDGHHTVNPETKTDIAKTFKRITKRQADQLKREQEESAQRILKVRQINRR